MSAILDKIEGILTDSFSIPNYLNLMNEILDGMQVVAPNNLRKDFPTNFAAHIVGYYHVGTYQTPEKNRVIVMAVELKKQLYVENSRSTQRSLAKKLIESASADAALVAFFTEGDPRWRLSFVRLDYEMKIEGGRLKTAENITPARRYSFLVGKDEPCHTAIERFRLFLENRITNPTLDDLETAFSVEAVTNEFFELYCEKFLQLRDCLEKNADFVEEAKLHNYTSAQFAKKLMGQIVFLYFLQKKGWLGVSAWPRELNAVDYKNAFFRRGSKSRELIPIVYSKVDENTYRINASALSRLSDEDETFLSTCVKGEPWGSGPHNFMRRLFETSEKRNANFFDDFLEPLFYDALNVNRGEQGYDPALHCRIPFLSGGLFEPIDGYDWKHNNFNIPNELFSNKKDHKDRLADGILDIFDRYNFTMSEDEPLEREVAIDPEMLGKVFENLLDVNDRKSKGAFYTPREIVHYMCQESLINYLTNTLHVSEMAIRDFILYGDFMKDEDASVLKRAEKGDTYDLWISEELYQLNNDGTIKVDRMAEFDKALQDVRVADPAVGSGAFPLGMLNEIVRARQNITTYMDITQKIIDPKGASREIRYRRLNDRSTHTLKYETIRNCIFAVDIEPSAVDIAQLRLWLALVIDDVIDPNAVSALDGHRNPLPLPNLECNILCGNSLIDDFEGIKLINESDIIGTAGDVMQVNLYQSAFDAMLQRLIAKQDELFRCDDTEKKYQILQDIDALRDDVILSQLRGTATDEQLSRYYETKNIASRPFVLWQLDFARIFREKGGFDIVIGNPPYIQLQKTLNENTSIKFGDLYEGHSFETFERTGDIYCLFYEKGWQLLRSSGTLCFITSNKWMKSGYGEKLRHFFVTKTNPLIFIDFAEKQLFDAAAVKVNILMFSKEENKRNTLACTAEDADLKEINQFITNHCVHIPYTSSSGWMIKSLTALRIQEKVEKQGVPLNKWKINIDYGIKTGCNEAFYIDCIVRDELIKNDPKSEELLLPLLRGRDIKKYAFVDSGIWMISTFPSRKYDIDDYPAIKQYLLSFGMEKLEQTGKVYTINGEKIKSRKKSNNQWFETQDTIGYWNRFNLPKIVYPNMTKYMPFYLDDAKYVTNQKCFIITGEHMGFLTAFLNSSLFKYCFMDYFPELLGNTREMSKIFFDKIPVIQVDDKTDEEYYTVVNQIQQMKKQGEDTTELEKQVDNSIFQLYGLTEEECKEIGFIEIT